MTAAALAGAREERRRRAGGAVPLALLAAFTVAVLILAAAIGPVLVPLGETVAILARAVGIDLGIAVDPVHETVVLAIRLPRVLHGALVGAVLALGGAALQGLFRNPLAEPALIGIAGGGALAAVATIVAGTHAFGAMPDAFAAYALPLAAFLGSLATATVVFRFATVSGRTDVTALLLAGIAINALTGAGTGFLVFLSNDDQLRTLTFWLLGSLAGATWPALGAALPFLVLPLMLLPAFARRLNAFALGERQAGHIGIDVETTKRLVMAIVSFGVGAAIATTGLIAFVGIVAPHLLRLVFGPDHRRLLPASALFGAALLPLADMVARLVVAPAELPIGAVTSALGAPVFLALLWRARRRIRT